MPSSTLFKEIQIPVLIVPKTYTIYGVRLNTDESVCCRTQAIAGERLGREEKLSSHAGYNLQGQGEDIPGIAFLSSNHEGSKAKLVGHVHLYMA